MEYARRCKRSVWKLPDWGNDFFYTPKELPNCSIQFTGTLRTHTDSIRDPRPVLLDVAKDLMRRLAREFDWDSAPIDYCDGLAWIHVVDGVAVGCVTSCESECELQLLGAWVSPEFRRRGVMTAMWQQVLEDVSDVIRGVVQPSEAMQCWMKKNQHLGLVAVN